MILFLLFFTAPLASLPNATLAAIIIVSSFGLFDIPSLRELFAASRRELSFSLVTTAGVLYFDVLPAVFLAILLTLLWVLLTTSRPHDAILGRVPGLRGYHDISDYPDAATFPGLLLYRFDGDILFFNVDYFKQQLLGAIAKSHTPIEWIIIDAGPINVVDITALQNVKDLIEDLEERGIIIRFARVKQSLWSYFESSWITSHQKLRKRTRYDTLTSAVEAFKQRGKQQDELERHKEP